MPAYLLDAESSDQYPVAEPICKIGSNASNNIVLTHDSVSPSHMRIEAKGNDYFVSVEPGAATTRKFLVFFSISTASHNGKPLQGRARVVDGDKLQIGSKLYNFIVTGK